MTAGGDSDESQGRSRYLLSLRVGYVPPVLLAAPGGENNEPDCVGILADHIRFYSAGRGGQCGFRARSVPAAILLLSALVILLSRSAVGASLFPQLTGVADWIRNYPSMSARRAILIGIGLGSLTTSLRVVLGIERTWLGGRK